MTSERNKDDLFLPWVSTLSPLEKYTLISALRGPDASHASEFKKFTTCFIREVTLKNYQEYGLRSKRVDGDVTQKTVREIYLYLVQGAREVHSHCISHLHQALTVIIHKHPDLEVKKEARRVSTLIKVLTDIRRAR